MTGLRRDFMKAMLISFAVGLAVGVVYALLRVKSPAPPLVALAGLMGMVWGEQVAAFIRPADGRAPSELPRKL